MQYTREERHTLERALASGAPLTCPACHAAVSAQPVPTPPDVSYVRHRVWVICPQCKRSASIDSDKPNKPTQ
jgi:hypothetical protein